MRIAIVHIRLLHRGGLETRLFSYMRYLRDAGHEVTVIVYRVGRGVKPPDGVKLIHVKIPFVRKAFKAAAFDRRLDGILEKEQFDFVLSLGRTSHHDAVLLPGNHLGYLKALGLPPKSASDRMQIEMDHQAYAAPGHILACSQMMKDEVVDLYGADPEKISILLPPTDPKRFRLDLKERQAELKAKFGFSPVKKSFVLVSASHSRKGLPLLLEAFAALQDAPVELWVAGGEKVVTQLPNVKGLGFVKETEELFAAADGTLLPALYEPFGQVVSESILCGTPVFVSHMVGGKCVVTPETGRIMETFDPKAWAAAIRKFNPAAYSFSHTFAQDHQLDLEGHMAKILSLAGKRD